MKKIVKNILPHGMVNLISRQKNHKNVPHTTQKLPKRLDSQPEIYNADGDKIHTFYLQDSLNEYYPYSFVFSATPKYINWDRFNYGLSTHFYSHNHVEKMNDEYAKKRFAYFIESEGLLRCDYDILLKDKSLATQFDAVFTTCEDHLNSLPNARFCPAGGVWYDKDSGGRGIMSEDAHQHKSKNISIVSSAKTFSPLHDARIAIAKNLKKEGLADTFGTFDGSGFVNICDTLKDYRYSIAIENHQTSFYFTEKILNCFAAQTVPIYIGASKIGDFFNEDGIIQTTADQLLQDPKSVLSQCSQSNYEQRLSAIIDNFNRVKEYSVIEDWLFSRYKDILI